MSGKKIVILLVVLGTVVMAGSAWYRSRARGRLLENLESVNLRAQAFTGLLRANGLLGLTREVRYNPRSQRAMKPYLRAQDARGRLWHVIQASTLDEEGRTQGAFFVFDQHGTVKDVFERTRAILLHAAQKRAVVALVKTTMDQPRATHSILVVGDFTEAVRLRGDFQLETVDGILDSRSWSLVPQKAAAAPERVPVFRYDPEAACFRGPPGSPEKPWEIDQKHSAKYCGPS